MKALVAGFGNMFFGDDGFGNEAARLLATVQLPHGVRVVDFGIRGMHAAFEMLEDYDLVVFLDAMQRGEAPGTLSVLEPSAMPAGSPDAHAMELHNALSFYESLCRDLRPRKRPEILIVGCEPENLEHGMGLSAAVHGSVPKVVTLVRSLLARCGFGAEKHETSNHP